MKLPDGNQLILLQRESPLTALSGHIEVSVRWSAFGAKRTRRDRWRRIDRTLMTRSGQVRAAFAATQRS